MKIFHRIEKQLDTSVAVVKDQVDVVKEKSFDENGIFSFFRRYSKFVIGFLVLLALVITPKVFGIFGMLTYLPLYSLFVVLIAVGARHWLFPNTLDDDAHSGFFTNQWQKIDPNVRVYINLGFLAVLILSISILASALIR